MAIEEGGIYRICATDVPTLHLAVNNASTHAGAWVQLWDNEDSNADKVMFEYADILGSEFFVKFLNSNMVLAVDSTQAKDGGRCCQTHHSYLPERAWTVVNTQETITINGTSYPVYQFRWVYKPEFYLDRNNAHAVKGAIVQIWHNNGGFENLGRKWICMRDAKYDESVAAPSNTFTGEHFIEGTSVNVQYTIKSGSHQYYQYRLRYKRLLHNGEWSGWSWWYSRVSGTTGSTYNDIGWGNAWENNLTGNNQTEPVNVYVAGQHDAFLYEMDVQAFYYDSNGNPCRGKRTTTQYKSVPKLLPANVGITSALLSLDGFKVGFTFNYPRTIGRKVLFWKIYDKTKNKDIMPSSKAFNLELTENQTNYVIPWDKLQFLPDDGDSLVFYMAYFTDGKYFKSQRLDKNTEIQCHYDGGNIDFEIHKNSVNAYDSTMYARTPTVPDVNQSEGALIFYSNGKTRIRSLNSIGGGSYRLYEPLGATYSILWYVAKTSTGQWGAKFATYTNNVKNAIVFNTEHHEIVFTMFPNGISDLTTSKEATTDEMSLEPRDFKSIFYSTVKSSKLSLEAIFPNNQRQEIEAALNEGYALVRAPIDIYCNVALLGLEFTPINENYTSVKINMTEVDNELDISISE